MSTSRTIIDRFTGFLRAEETVLVVLSLVHEGITVALGVGFGGGGKWSASVECVGEHGGETIGLGVCMQSLRSKDISRGRFRAIDEEEVVLAPPGSRGGSNCMDSDIVSGTTT